MTKRSLFHLLFTFKQPKFWHSVNIIAILLWPISLLYALVSKIRYTLQTPKKFDVSVICIGNTNIGGAGKTPLAIAVGKFLKREYPKLRIVYACRNYSGNIEGPVMLNSGHFQPGIIDEALMLSKTLPTVVAKSRFETIKYACSVADIVITDDGFQNNSFHKDISILAVPADQCFGNRLIFPAGPLRETLKGSLKRADIVFLMNKTENSHVKSWAILNSHFDKKNIFSTQYKHEIMLEEKPVSRLKKSVVAFCGIAHPEQFFDLVSDRAHIVARVIFPDHHVYSKDEQKILFERAKESDAFLITTEKDFVKFDKEQQKHLMVMKITVILPKSAKKQIKRLLESNI